jgi:hypothetical protein
MFTNGHKQLCKHLFVIEVLLDDGELTLEDPTISLHALTGIQSSLARTKMSIVSNKHCKYLKQY